MSKYARQIDLITPDEINFPIHVIGCGGIGSWTALLLAKMGCQDITIYDNDTVEEHNVASQFFKDSQLGSEKTSALAENVYEQTGVVVKIVNDIQMESLIDSGVVIIAVDSMEERIRLSSFYKERDVYIIDGRMGGLQMEVYCSESKNYEATLCDPNSVDHDPCTGRSISFNCATIGSWIANFVRLYSKKRLTERSVVFDFENMILLSDSPLRSQV